MKRWTLRIVLLLVLGCVTTVAVAWGCALRPIYAFESRLDEEFTNEAAAVLRSSPHHFDTSVGSRAGHSNRVETFTSPGGFVGVSRHSVGLPARALEATCIEWDMGSDAGFAIHAGFQISRYRIIPLAPIWPGFVIDTLFYGLIWFGIFFGFGSARRAIRRHRGRCPKCAYHLCGDFNAGCSECGWNRPEGAQ